MQRWVSGFALALAISTAAEAREKRENDIGDVNVFLKGGVGSFTGDLNSVVRAGPAYGLTLNLQPWNVVGFELGYDGSRHVVPADNGGVMRNGGTALLKLGLPFLEKVRPFVAGGVGATYVNTFGSTSTVNNDFMGEVPVLGGLEFNLGSVTAGVRGGYRILFDESFADNAPANSGGLVDVTASLGGRF